MRSLKSKRQQEILRIIEETQVETQDQLLSALKARGVQATQATISRDIKELHLFKEPVGSGAYCYRRVMAGRNGVNASGRLRTIFKESVISFDAAQNIVVVRTMPGLASAAGTAIDAMGIGELVGSLAGDDTVLLIMRTAQAAAAFCDEIHGMLDQA